MHRSNHIRNRAADAYSTPQIPVVRDIAITLRPLNLRALEVTGSGCNRRTLLYWCLGLLQHTGCHTTLSSTIRGATLIAFPPKQLFEIGPTVVSLLGQWDRFRYPGYTAIDAHRSLTQEYPLQQRPRIFRS
jgi:hypothetical protein